MSDDEEVGYIVECIMCPSATVIGFVGMKVVHNPEGWTEINPYNFKCPKCAEEGSV